MSKCKHLFLLFTLFLFTGLSLNSYAGPVTVPVPDVTNTPIADARATIIGADLTVGNETTASSNSIIVGNVISQNPVVGTEVAVGSAVDLEVSTGPAPTTTTTSTSTTTTTSSTAATTSSTAATTSSTAATTSSTAATTTTTQSGGTPTTTTAAATTTTAATTSTTTAAATTTTTQISVDTGGDDDRFDFGGSGCTISNTQSATMDPIWLLMLLVPGLGILRRHVAATGTARKTSS
jgi:hypothetical protein